MSKYMLWCAPHRKQDLPRHSLLHRLCYLPCECLMDLLCLPCPGSSSCFVNVYTTSPALDWLLRMRVQDIVLAQHLPSVKQTNKQTTLLILCACVWRSEDNFLESIFTLWIPRDGTRVTWHMANTSCLPNPGQLLPVHANTLELVGAVTTSYRDGSSEIQVCDCLVSQF